MLIGIKDIWGPDPNKGCRSFGYATMKEAYEKTLSRVKALGADKITFTNFDYQPSIKGFEDTYQEEMFALLQKIRSTYSGKVLLLLDPVR